MGVCAVTSVRKIEHPARGRDRRRGRKAERERGREVESRDGQFCSNAHRDYVSMHI